MQALSFLETAFIDWVHPFTLQAKTIKKLQFRVKNFPGYKLSVEHRFVLEFSQVIFFIYFLHKACFTAADPLKCITFSPG